MSGLSPKERLWRKAVAALASQVIDQLDGDPEAAPESYAGRVEWAARLLEREAGDVGGKSAASPDTSGWKHGIDPNELYTAPEAAELLGLKSSKTVYSWGRRPGAKGLKVIRTGPKGGGVRIPGHEIIRHRERLC